MKTKKADIPYCGARKFVVEGADPELNWEAVYYFKQFVIDRYRVHKRKDVDQLPAPWTKNPVLQEFKFTNVRREHDRQTRYLLQNISTNDKLTLEDKIVNTFLFRAWNNWDTLKDFGFPYPAEWLYKTKMKERMRPRYEKLLAKNPDRKWWSNAFNQGGFKMVWGYPDGTARSLYEREGAERHHEPDIPLRPFHIAPYLKKHHIVEKILKASTQEEVFSIIKTVPGYADFMAYQVFVDLTYIKDFPFSENEFVVAGPGCKRGLDHIFINKDGMTYEECIFWLRNHILGGFEGGYTLFNNSELEDWCYDHNKSYHKYRPNKLFSDLPECDRYMNVMSIENCMCELSKYIKAVKGTGRPRNKYKPYKEVG